MLGNSIEMYFILMFLKFKITYLAQFWNLTMLSGIIFKQKDQTGLSKVHIFNKSYSQLTPRQNEFCPQ